MKNLFKNLMLVAVAAMAFTACQKDNEDVNRVNETTVVEFKAEFDTTRSGFNEKDAEGYSSHWDGNEVIDLEVVSTNDGGVSYTSSTPSGDDVIMGEDGTFRAELNGTIYNEGTITARIPAGSWETDNYTHEKVPSIPGTQTPEVGSVDPAAHILKAEKEFVGGMSKGYTLAFAHQVAYAKMTLDTTLAIAEIAQVVVEIDAQRYTLLNENLSEPTFWFACKEATPEAMTVTITDVNDKTYVKELNLAGASKKLVFTTGRVASFTVGGFEEVVLDYVKSISASYNQYNSRYEFTIDANDGARLWSYLYAAPDAKGLLPAGEYDSDESYQSSFGYMYADYANEKGYEDFTYYYVTVAQSDDEGYEISFYLMGNKGAELTFEYSGVVSGINNPPAPAADNVTTAPESVSGRATKDAWDYTYYLSFVAGDWTIDGLYFYASVSSNGIIPETTETPYTIRGGTATLTDTTWAFSITSGTVNVEHSGENYVLEFAFEDANGSTYEFSYTGVIEGDGIFQPGTEKLATPTNVVATAEGKEITVTWDAVDGATNYTVNVEGLNSNTFNETTGTFEGKWGTTYTVTVVANSDGTKLDSDPATTTVTTDPKPEIPATTVTFTQVTTQDESSYDMGVPAVQLAFSDGGSNTLNLYVFCDSSYVLNGDATADDYQFAKGYIFPVMSDFNGKKIWGGTVNFAHDGENYTVTMTGLTDETDYEDGTFKLNGSYTGKIEFDGKNMGAEGGEGDEGAAFVRAEYDFKMKLYAFNPEADAEYAFRLFDADDNYLEVICEYGNHTGWDFKYTVNYVKKDGTTVSGYTSLQTQKPNDWNCADGEKYYAVIVTLSDGTEFNIQDQIPSTEVDLYQ